jgi:hypothetical protein
MLSLRMKPNENNKMVSDDWDEVDVVNFTVDSIYFYYNKNLAIGALLDFKIHFSTAPTIISCTGKVIRTKKHLNSFMSGIAAVLVNMDEREREFIERSVLEDPKHDNQLTLAF